MLGCCNVWLSLARSLLPPPLCGPLGLLEKPRPLFSGVPRCKAEVDRPTSSRAARKVEEEVEEEDEMHSEPACPWEAACTAAAFITPDPSLMLRLLLHRTVMIFRLSWDFQYEDFPFQTTRRGRVGGLRLHATWFKQGLLPPCTFWVNQALVFFFLTF